METKDDVEVIRVTTGALIRRMADDQINRVIGELEYIAEERGDRTGESAHGQAAQHLVVALEARRERRNGQSIPPPSLDLSSNGHEASPPEQSLQWPQVGPHARSPCAAVRTCVGTLGEDVSVERPFETKPLPRDPDAVAPDGSDVRVLLQARGGGLAHFELAAGQTSVAVRHRTVEEVWYFLRGRGEMWRRSGGQEAVVTVASGVCITIPTGTAFQFRVVGDEPLAALGVTIPPWPGTGEAEIVAGPWEPTVQPGPN